MLWQTLYNRSSKCVYFVYANISLSDRNQNSEEHIDCWFKMCLNEASVKQYVYSLQLTYSQWVSSELWMKCDYISCNSCILLCDFIRPTFCDKVQDFLPPTHILIKSERSVLKRFRIKTNTLMPIVVQNCSFWPLKKKGQEKHKPRTL